MELQVGVKIALRNKNGKFLLLRRASLHIKEKVRSWDFPGGRIEPGTELVDNLKREVFEETKLNFNGKVKIIAAQDILRDGLKHVVRITYIGSIEGKPVLNNEHDDYKWLSLEELKKLSDLDIYAKELVDKEILFI